MSSEFFHPLDLVEEIFAANDWPFERALADELVAEVAGRWADYSLMFAWREDVNKQGHGLSHQHGEDAADFASEAVMMGLRLREGIDLNLIETLAGPRSEWLNSDEVMHLCRQGLLALQEDCLTLTDDGKTVMNTGIGRILK